MPDIPLLRIPERLPTASAVLQTALHLNLNAIIVCGEKSDGEIVLLTTDEMTLQQANWILDMLKHRLFDMGEG